MKACMEAATARPRGHVLGTILGPSDQIHLVHERRLSRLLAAATLACAALMVLALVLLPSRVGTGGPWTRDPTVWVTLVGIPAYLALYALNRRGHYRAAAWAFVFVTFDLSWTFTILVQGSGYFVGNYAYLVFTVIVAALFVSLWLTALYAVLNLVGVGLLNAHFGLEVQDLWLSYAYLAIFSTLLLLTAGLRERDQRNLEQQSHQLERSVADTDAMLANTDTALFSIDRAGVLRTANTHARRLGALLGAAMEPGRPLHALLPATAARALMPHLDRALEGDGVTVEHAADLEGEARHYELRLHPIRLPDGTVAGVSGAVRDVTDRVRREEERLAAYAQAKELEVLRERTEATQRFLNLASHGLNTPLTPIQLQLNLLKHRAQGEQAQALEMLDRNVRRVRHLVDQILTVVQLDTPSPSLRSPVDLDALVADAVEAQRPAAEGRGVRIRFEPGATPWVAGHPGLLRDVLSGLLQNGVQAMRRPGQVVVRTRSVGTEVRLEVQDEGVGLEPALLERAGEPFVLAQDTGSTGAGLGLFVARRIVEAHGGRFGLESPGPGRGATAWVALPCPPGTH